MVRKRKKRKRYKEEKQKEQMALEQEKKEQEEQKLREINKKKPRKHVLDQMQFQNENQKNTSDVLIAHFLKDHYPKIIYIKAKESDEFALPFDFEYLETDDKGEELDYDYEIEEEDFRTPGKLYGELIKSIKTKETYSRRIKTFIKWHVIHKGITELSEITPETTEEFLQTIADSTGPEKDQYSKKTYDNYIDAIYKFASATTKDPEEVNQYKAKRELSPVIGQHAAICNREFKEKMRRKVEDYKREEYKRGSGYSQTNASTIMREAEKHMDLEKQLAVALYVYGGVRNEEGIDITHSCIDVENKRINLTTANTKHGRPRIVQDVDERFFDKYKKYVEITGDTEGRIFKEFHEDSVRDIAKECCNTGKIRYSGVHDLRKAYVEREEKQLYKAILNGEITKEELVGKIMAAVDSDPRLNRMVYPIEWRKRTTKDGETVYYPKKDKTKEKEQNFQPEKLMKMNIENLADMFIAQQLGHNDPYTTAEYRTDKARENRNNFRQEMKSRRDEEKEKK